MWGIYDKDSEPWAIVHSGASSHGGWSDSDLTDTGRFVKAYLLKEAGGGPAPSPPTPAPTPGTKTCSARGGCSCDCAWANPNTCHNDDGSCCWACCCSSQLLLGTASDGIIV